MEILLVSAVFLGLVAGYFLAWIAAEEIRPGYKYFVIMQNILFASVIASVTLYLTGSIWIPVIIAVAVFSVLYWKDFAGWLYPITGLALFVVKDDAAYLTLVSALLFLLGLAVAAIAAFDFVKEEKIGLLPYLKHLLIRHVWFIPVALLPFLFSNLQ